MSAVSDFDRAVKRYRKAQERLDDARVELRHAMTAARKDGVTLQRLADSLGVSRQRALRFLEGR